MGPLEHLSGCELVMRKSVAENKQMMMMHGDRKGRDAMMNEEAGTSQELASILGWN